MRVLAAIWRFGLRAARYAISSRAEARHLGGHRDRSPVGSEDPAEQAQYQPLDGYAGEAGLCAALETSPSNMLDICHCKHSSRFPPQLWARNSPGGSSPSSSRRVAEIRRRRYRVTGTIGLPSCCSQVARRMTVRRTPNPS